MKNILFLTLCLSFCVMQAQLYVSADTEIYISSDDNLYSNENIINEGKIQLNDASRLIFDGNLTNNNLIAYTNGTDKGILQIGSGEVSSVSAQNIKFHPTVTEEAPFIILNKNSQEASVTRGHLRLTEQLKSISGTLNAQSSISETGESSGLTFASPDITTTSIVEESDGGNVVNVIVERFIPNSSRAWRYLSSPVSTNESIKENLQEGANITSPGQVANPFPGYGTHITGSKTGTLGFDATLTGNSSMYFWDGGAQQWNSTPNTDTRQLAAGEAYAILVRGGRELDLTAGNDQLGSSTILRTLGNLHIGAYNTPNLAPTTGDFSLVGNPYQAQVDLEALLNSGNNGGVSNNFVYYYDPNLGVQGAYATMDFGNGITPSVSEASKYLQPNQAFVVQTTTSNPTLLFDENFKRPTDQTKINGVFSPAQKGKSDLDNDKLDTDFKIDVNLFDTDANVTKDGVTLRFNAAYNDEILPEEDAPKFWNRDESLAVLNQGQYLSIDKRHIVKEMANAQLYISNYRNSNYSLQISIKNAPAGSKVVLIDNYLNTQTLLEENANRHDFSIDKNVAQSIDQSRFKLGLYSNSLSVPSTAELSSIGFYPNPAVDKLNIDLNTTDDVLKELQIFSSDGKLVKQIAVDNLTEKQIEVGDLPRGIYLVEMQTVKGKAVKKLILH
ncbi:MAG: T9SS type A sorting domain-containing protein [Leeuwenhoekiella sp.]